MEKDLSLSYKMFHDSVHGDINLHPLCVKIIDTPEFQRLRFISQVGPVVYVYPSAIHTRFEHCLGVCHLAGLFVKSLKANQPELDITDEDVLCVEIAGLCHDVGHGPFSHLWEKFMMAARPEIHWKHEETSVKMFDHLLSINNLHSECKKYNLNENDLIFVKELINCGAPNSEKWSFKGRPQSKGYLYQIIANKINGVDVDKWDYFLRDSYHLGIKFMFEYSRLIEFSRVLMLDSGPQICFREKEVDNIYNMFHTRKSLHRVAYKHRVALTISQMIVDAFLDANEHIKFTADDGSLLCMSEAVNDITAFKQMTDILLMVIYTSNSSHPNVLKAKGIIRRIFTRKLYAFIGNTGPTSKIEKSDDIVQKILTHIPTKLKPIREDLAVREILIDFGTGAENPLEKVRFYSKNKPCTPMKLRKEDVSALLPHTFEEKMFLILCRRDDDEFIKEAHAAFLLVCKQFSFRRSSFKSFVHDFTPDKTCSRGRSKSENFASSQDFKVELPTSRKINL